MPLVTLTLWKQISDYDGKAERLIPQIPDIVSECLPASIQTVT